jgi:hypothetical protein
MPGSWLSSLSATTAVVALPDQDGQKLSASVEAGRFSQAALVAAHRSG